jgi:hypothetical protein
MLDGPEWRRLLHRVWVHASVEDSLALRLAAVKLVLPPHAVVCGLTAAWLFGVDVRRLDDLDVHVSFPAGKRRRPQAGLVVSQETLGPGDVCVIGGIRVTTAVRTAFDCLRLLRGAERVVVADALTHLGRTSVAELRAYFATQHRLRNIRVGEQMLDQVEPASESPMESRVRLSFVAAGLPRPVAQWELRQNGEFVARLDLAWPELKVAVEYDGAWHWAQRQQDDRRRDRVRALGWVVIVVHADDYYRRRDLMCQEVAAALDVARRRIAS